MIVSLGLSGAMFSTMVFFTKYQWWFVGLSIGMLGFAHYSSWKRKEKLPIFHFIVLWIATVVTISSVTFVLYTYGFFTLGVD